MTVRSSLLGFLIGSTVSLSAGYYYLLHESSPFSSHLIQTLELFDAKTSSSLSKIQQSQQEVEILLRQLVNK